MVVGAPNYQKELTKMALSSSGALSLDYLMSHGASFIIDINEAAQEMEIANGE